MDFSVALSLIINGLCLGGVYGLLSSSFSFQLGWLKVVNFSFGAITMFAMYLVFILINNYQLSLFFSVLFVVLFMILFGYFVRHFLIKREDDEFQILVTMGLGVFIENLALLIWGSFPRSVSFLEKGLLIGHIYIPVTRLLILLLAAFTLFGFNYFLTRSWMGKAIQAVVQNREIANILGVNVKQLESIAFALSWALIAISAGMLILLFSIEPTIGGHFLLLSFIVVVMGGMSNLRATFFSGLAIGVTSSIVSYFAPSFYDPILFIVFITLLLLKRIS